MTEVGRNAFYGYSDESGNVKSITCRAQTPPELGQTPFDGIGKNVEGKKYLYSPGGLLRGLTIRHVTLLRVV